MSGERLETSKDRLVSVGVMAYNEEALISATLSSIKNQNQEYMTIDEIIVIISGSTDDTERIVRAITLEDPRIRIVVEPKRIGKIYSVIHFLELAANEICVVASSDIVADQRCFDNLFRPLCNDFNVGMTGPRVRPYTPAGRSTLAVKLHRELWEMHHQVALRHPKLGEIVMVRKGFVQNLQCVAGCDEVMLESAVCVNGGTLSYVPDAIVHNFGPTAIADYIDHRRRIHAMHLVTRRELGYEAATVSVRHNLIPVLGFMLRQPRKLGLILILIAIELKSRLSAHVDANRGNRNLSWVPSKSARSDTICLEQQ